MGKRIIIGMFIAFSFMLPVYGHLTGAFADFLAIVYDRSTIDHLTEEMEEMQQQIEELEPEVEQLELDFEDRQQTAVEQLQLYADSGLDVWLSMMAAGEDPEELVGFKLDYSAAGKLNGAEHPYFTQTDGALELHRK